MTFYEEPVPFQPALPDRALIYKENKPPTKHIILAMEVVAWIAFRRFIPFSQMSCLWRSYPGLEPAGGDLALLAALNARAAISTGFYYCLSSPTKHSSDEIPSRYEVLRRDGPRILRWLRAQYRRQSGTLMTFKEIATLHHNQIMADFMVSNRLKCAMVDLREALAAELVSAYGVPYGTVGKAEPSCVAEKIPHTVFIPQEVTFSLWNGLAMDDDVASNDRIRRALPRYEQITFKTHDVLKIWPSHSVVAPSTGSQLGASAKQGTGLADQAETSPIEKVQKPSRGRGGKSYAPQDAPLIAEMEVLLANGTASSPWVATDHVVARAAGGGTAEAKRKRLLRGFQNRSALNRTEHE